MMAVAFRDGYPVTPLHTLVKPKRHVADYFDLYQPDLNAINQLLQKLKGSIVEEDDTVTGFNVGVMQASQLVRLCFTVTCT